MGERTENVFAQPQTPLCSLNASELLYGWVAVYKGVQAGTGARNDLTSEYG